MVTVWFPVGSPKLGLMRLIVGVVGVGVTGMTASWKLIVMLFVTLLTVAFTTTGPAVLAVTVALAMPAVVVRISVVGLSVVSVKLALRLVVENSTAVPFGTGVLFCVTVAVIVDIEPVVAGFVDATSAMVAPPGGGVAPLPVPVPVVPVMGGGAVGDSPLHPAKSAKSATSARKMDCRFVCFMSTPVNSSSHPHRPGPEGRRGN